MKLATILLVVLSMCNLVHAQTKDTSQLGGSFSGATINELVRLLESKTGYYFYYDIKQTDSLQFSFPFSNETLSSVLSKAFSNTPFYFAITTDGKIFITRNRPVVVDLQPDSGRIDISRNTRLSKIKLADSVSNDKTPFGKAKVLETVTISTAANLKGTQMGVQTIDIKTVRQVPVVFGEPDIIKTLTTLPGVKTVGEASTGLNVRGGSADQNLILFNDATIFNPSHFFGIFSAFNPDVVKDATLYKSSMPPRYGGRLSSVLDISSREGNGKKFSGSAGIGPVTSRIMLEGPIIKDKTTFLLGARSTYADWLLGLLPSEYENSKTSFYDVNLILSHKFSDKNSLTFTGYYSYDRFNLNSDTVYGYGNADFALAWKYGFSKKLALSLTAGTDRYSYDISSDKIPIYAYRLKFSIDQQYFKAHFNYYLSTKHNLDFGLNSTRYDLQPGTFQPKGKESLIVPDIMERDRGLESALYVNDKYDVNADLSIEGGVRFSVFNALGPRTVNTYAPGSPKTDETLISTDEYSSGKFVKTYSAPEFRASLRYALTKDFSIKAAVNTQRQYIHSLSNTTAVAPTDIWKLSDVNIKPQSGRQISLGFYKNFNSDQIQTSLEVYYKWIDNYLDYKSGASLILNHTIERDVLSTHGKAYGAEFLLKKVAGKLNGWISYTWSRILLQQNDPSQGELVNGGKYYPANYDKPHDVTCISNYKFAQRFSVSLNATYSTGRPITVPIGRYFYANSFRTLYADRNANRIPHYFRMDFSMNIDGNHKVKQVFHNSWTIGVYNLTARKNPYSVYYVSQDGAINGYKLSIFGTAIPFVTYNVRF